jgi:transcriptional regulator GlxA family with amidase domain
VWKGRAASDATWEKLEEFKKAYPEVQLEDELFVGEREMLWTLSSARYTSAGNQIEKESQLSYVIY